MKDAVLVFKEGEDGEQAWALERRHAQVLGLEGEGQPNPLVAEEGAEFGVEASPRLEHRHQPDQVGGSEVAPALKWLLEERGEPLELGPRGLHEAGERPAIGRGQPRHLRLHPGDIGGGEQVATGAEDQPILRVETHHLDLPPEVEAAGREDLLEDPRIEKECRPKVKPKALGRRDRAGAAPGHGQPFDHPHSHAGLGQKHGRGQSARPGSDDIDRPRHPGPSITPDRERTSLPRYGARTIESRSRGSTNENRSAWHREGPAADLAAQYGMK